jgi:hypothetical protein
MVKCNPEFEAIIATEDQEFSLGDIKIKALHTLDIPWKIPPIY